MAPLSYAPELIALLLGVLPLLVRRVREWALWLAVAWSLPALLIGALGLISAALVPGPREALGTLMTRWPWLARAYLAVPMDVGVACGLNAIICYIVALRTVRPLRQRCVVALGVLVLLAVTAPSVPLVYVKLEMAHWMRDAAAAAAAQPSSAAAQAEYAQWLHGAGRYTEALRFAERAEALDQSRDWDYPHQVGLILLSLKQPSRALAPLQRAYRLQRAEKPPANPLAERLRRSGLSEAEIERTTGDPRVWRKLIRDNEAEVARTYAAALVLNDRVQEATEVMGRAVSRLPDDRSVRSLHLLLLWSQGREGEATAELPALAQSPGMDLDRMTRWVRRYHNQAAAQRELRRWAEGYTR